MSYVDFGKLRFLDFFPKTDAYFVAPPGIDLFGIGWAIAEGYRFTHFARPEKSMATALIEITFDGITPEREGNAFLKYLKLGIQKGTDYSEVKKTFGIPLEDFGPPDKLGGLTQVKYVVGSQWPYCVHCDVQQKGGLCRIWICRKDFVDRYEAWQASI